MEKNNNIECQNNIFAKKKTFDKDDAAQLDALNLAFLGDAIHTFYVRHNLLCNNTGSTINKLHKKTSDEIKASAQAKRINYFLDTLSNEELTIYKRGRNSKVHTVAKNASVVEYKKATGFETLIGYLYLTGQLERMYELLAPIEDKNDN